MDELIESESESRSELDPEVDPEVDSESEDVSSEEESELVSDDDSVDWPLPTCPGAWKMKPFRSTPPTGAPSAASLATGNGRRLFRTVSSVYSVLRLGRRVRRRKLFQPSIK